MVRVLIVIQRMRVQFPPVTLGIRVINGYPKTRQRQRGDITVWWVCEVGSSAIRETLKIGVG